MDGKLPSSQYRFRPLRPTHQATFRGGFFIESGHYVLIDVPYLDYFACFGPYMDFVCNSSSKTQFANCASI